MLSAPYVEIKRLRSTGDCAGAISQLSAQPPTSDEDALEAAVCLLICGQPENAVHVCRTYSWKTHGVRQIAQALEQTLAGGDDARALTLARAATADRASSCDASALYLLLLQKNGLLDEAQAYIAERWQDPPAGETFLLTLMAEIAVATKNWRQAYRFACAVLAADPDDFRALIALSVANLKEGNVHESLGNARRAQRIDQGSAAAILQIMRCENKLGDHYAALAVFDDLRDRDALPADLQVELAKAYTGLEHRAQATEAYRAALAADPGNVEAVRELASIYSIAGDTAELESLATRHAAEFGGDVDAIYWRGLAALNRGDSDGAARLFRESLAVADARGDASNVLPWPVPEPRLRHDYEQLDLLERRGKLNSAGRDGLKVLVRYYDRSADPKTMYAPQGPDGQALMRVLGTYYNVPRMRFSERALGDNDYSAIEDKYFAERLVVIDDFLSPDALEALRTFSEEATVWKSYSRHGYVGAIIALGFSPDVLLALSEELRRAMPRVIGDQPLLQAWGFKYDQRMPGINMHADFAKVNVNFWITPDEACEDPTSGGMVVYDSPVPNTWSVADYNSNPARLSAYIKLHEAKPLRVTYRANRCVLFDSRLIHTTDRLRFKPGYENRRVNVTLLYGRGLSMH